MIPRALLLALAITSLPTGVPADEPAAIFGETGPLLRLATGSPGDLGLVQALAEGFASEEPIRLAWYRAGSGASLGLLREGRVDLIMVHAPEAEAAAVEEGWAQGRRLVGGNVYYLVGPAEDPAAVAAAGTVTEALRRVAEARARFVSRGDNSGTHQRELALWAQAGIEPSGDWYRVSGDFMEASLRLAAEIAAYFLTDSSTWAALRSELPGLAILHSGDPGLINRYRILIGSDRPGAGLAWRFADYLVGDGGQAVIGGFGRQRFGMPLYFNAHDLEAQDPR